MKTKWRFLTISELAAVVLVIAVVAVVLVKGLSIFSPGSLSARSGQDSSLVLDLSFSLQNPRPSTDLNGVSNHAQLSGDCGACHAPPWSSETMAQRCLKCHTKVAGELQNPHDLHYMTASSVESLSCTSQCHTEHLGPDASITLLKSEHFNNAQGKFSLKGHKTNSNGLPFGCVDCHLSGLDKFDPESCLACHKQIDSAFAQTHVSTFGLDCFKCHDGLDTYGKNFNHNQVKFKLLGAHAASSTTCSDCHQDAGTISQLKAAPQDCNSCHQKDDKHKGTFGLDCGQCHSDVNWKQINYDHQKTVYPLSGKHATADCLSCHVDNVLKGLPKDCGSCHQKDDKHEGKLDNCSLCHSTSDWKQVTFDHRPTVYQLTGKHATVECTSCHANNLYKGAPQDCNSCHAKKDKHEGALGQNCTQCHTTSDWKEVTFKHGTTSYPLTGKHSAVDCASCHANGLLKGTSADCYSCHQKKDKHSGALGQNCAQCHVTSDWKEVTFKHETTAYPLTGKHSTVDCASCHASGKLKGTPTDCYSCHQKTDKHQGAFGRDCTSCHKTTAWKDVTFDHSKSNFPLGGKHAGVPCSGCHANGVFKGTPSTCISCHQSTAAHFGADCASCHNTTDWTQASVNHALTAFPLTGKHTSLACSSCHVNGVYKGTAKDCYSCHKAKDAHNGTNGANCASCHNTTDWTQATVNHVLTAFPLTGKHTSLACSSCHVNGVYKGTAKDCYSCHKAKDAHNGTNGANCASCHNTTDWTQASVNHALTAFPLTGKHTALACSSCHVNGVYKGTATDCYSCHKSKDAHNGSNGTNCASCHNTTDWTQATVDHSITAFPLSGKHLPLTCSSCHVNGVYKGTAKDCYSCHQSKDSHGGSLGTNCASCHTTSGWPTTTIDHVNLTAFPLTGKHTTRPAPPVM